MLKSLTAIYLKDFASYFRSRIAYAVLFIYLVLSMILNFYTAGYFELLNDNMQSFFFYQPELLLLFIPALAVKVWTDERRYGTLEILLTNPLSYKAVVIGKFLALWSFCGIMLVATFPLWLTTNILLPADNINIFFSYMSLFLAAGGLCAVSCAVSSAVSGAATSYILSLFVCAVIKLVNFDYIFRLLNIPTELALKISHSLNFDYQYLNLIQGQAGLAEFIYFAGLITAALWFNVVMVEYKRG